jgi:SM-20-related protein
MPELLILDDFVPYERRKIILAELSAASASQAKVYGSSVAGTVDPRVRSVLTVKTSSSTVEWVVANLLRIRPTLETYFSVELGELEEPQFLRYRVGDHFVAHQDGNTGLIYDETRHRRVSIVVFLNERSDKSTEETYDGGSLVLHGAYPDFALRDEVPCLAGGLAAFRSETTHEVLPITQGERFTIVSWFRAVGE